MKISLSELCTPLYETDHSQQASIVAENEVGNSTKKGCLSGFSGDLKFEGTIIFEVVVL